MIALNGYLLLNLHICGYLIYCAYCGRKPSPAFYVPFVFIAIVWAVSIHTVTAFLYVGLNGRPLACSAASKGPSRLWSFDVPSDRLQRLNRITIAPGPNGSLEVSRLRIECEGRSFGDVRFSPAMKRSTSRSGRDKTSLDYYIDLTYPGPRGAP